MDKATTAPTHPPVGGGFVISAPSSGQGKTAITLGLLRAFRRSGMSIVSGKAGPDYIDPAFHAAATGRPCLTLDSWAFREGELRAMAACEDAEVRIVEGAMGLFDGPVGPEDVPPTPVPGSTAHVARTLGVPVVLVLDARRMGQSAAAIVSGLSSWAEGVEIAGVILNRVASPRHAAMVSAGIEGLCPILGIIPPDARLEMPARHLGLVQASENADLDTFLEGAADVIQAHCDLPALRNVARPLPGGGDKTLLAPLGQRIAVAQDIAFAFSYPHVLKGWRAQGAELSFFSPLADQAPDPDCDAVYLPGGYPELHAGKLASAAGFHQGLNTAVKRGALVYGECGGFMFLGDGLVDANGEVHQMAGLLRLETSFAQRKLHLGYRMLSPLAGPWSGCLKAHEFHYSTVIRAEGAPLFKAHDSAGKDLSDMGLIEGNVMGSYAHVISTEAR